MKFSFSISPVLLLSLLVTNVFSQNKKPYSVSPNSVKYKIHKDQKGTLAKQGDIVELNIINRNEKDSVIFNTYETGSPLTLQISKPEYKGDIMYGLMLLSKGDSATFWFDIDSIRDFEPIPGVLDKGTMMKYTVKIEGIYSQEEYKKHQLEISNVQLKKDTLVILKYLKDNNIKNYKRTSSGLYYVIDAEGADKNVHPAKGQKVKVHYTGTLLNGEKFDSSRDRDAPLEFSLGIGQVISGWDEGIALLSKGARGRLFIPSALGYGTQGAGGTIPPNTVLVFDVELVDF